MGRGMRGRKERGASFHGEHRSHEIRDWKLLTEEQVRGWVSGLTLRITQTSASTFAVECQLEKKKKSHNPKVELFSLVEKLKPPNLGGSISVALRKLHQGCGRGTQAIYKLAIKWDKQSEYQILLLSKQTDDHYIYCCGQESLRRNGVTIMVNKRV